MGGQGNLWFLFIAQFILNQIHPQTNQTYLGHTLRKNHSWGNGVVLKMTFIEEFILFKGIVTRDVMFRNGRNPVHKQKWGLIGQ